MVFFTENISARLYFETALECLSKKDSEKESEYQLQLEKLSENSFNELSKKEFEQVRYSINHLIHYYDLSSRTGMKDELVNIMMIFHRKYTMLGQNRDILDVVPVVKLLIPDDQTILIADIEQYQQDLAFKAPELRIGGQVYKDFSYILGQHIAALTEDWQKSIANFMQRKYTSPAIMT